LITPEPAVEGVLAGTAEQKVTAIAAQQRIIASTAIDEIDSVIANDQITIIQAGKVRRCPNYDSTSCVL
jgi:hypothetical protein